MELEQRSVLWRALSVVKRPISAQCIREIGQCLPSASIQQQMHAYDRASEVQVVCLNTILA